jgi:hypothetical protein
MEMIALLLLGLLVSAPANPATAPSIPRMPPRTAPSWVEATRGVPALDTVVALAGREADEWFGVAVAGAGDVNGDGYDDLIVGAYANNDGGPDGGRADVYFGGPELDPVPHLTVIGHEADYLGTSVGGGDVNGDGFSDVIVGSPADDGAAPNAGTAFVYFGGPAADTIPDLVLRGEGSEDYFAQSSAIVADQNGDGFSDVVVGAWKNDFAADDAGRAYLYFGGPLADSLPDRVYTGEATLDNFGFFVAGAGDVNGDGAGDLIIGAPYHDGAGYNAGRAYVYFGGISGDSIADVLLDGESDFHSFGFSASTAGDVDGDGYDDVVVGAVFAGAINAGRAYLFRGGAWPDATPDLVLDGDDATDQFGCAVGTAGDWNRDGFDDLLVGAFHRDANGRDAGRVGLWLGGATLDATADRILDGGALLDAFGFSLGPAGDLNGDGWPEFAVGAPLAEAGDQRPGRAYAFASDQATPTTLAMFRAEARDRVIEVRWAFAPAAPVRDAELERAEDPLGPWFAPAVEIRVENGVTIAIDRAVVAGRRYWYRLLAHDADGAPWPFAPIAIEAGAVVGAFDLAAPYPNPVRDRLAVEIAVPRAARVEAALVDVQGRALGTLVDGTLDAGKHVVTWEGERVAPGVYWLVLRAPGTHIARRIVVAR